MWVGGGRELGGGGRRELGGLWGGCAMCMGGGLGLNTDYEGRTGHYEGEFSRKYRKISSLLELSIQYIVGYISTCTIQNFI